MTGTWTGTYVYTDLAHIDVEVTFTLNITDFDGQYFKGNIQDDLESGGTKGQGTVEGTFKEGRLKFLKQMPVLTFLTKNGRLEFPKKHKPIYYSGIQIDEGFEGAWKIKSRLTINKYVFAIGGGATGTWKMWRQPEGI